MNKEMEHEAAINAIVELVHEVGTGCWKSIFPGPPRTTASPMEFLQASITAAAARRSGSETNKQKGPPRTAASPMEFLQASITAAAARRSGSETNKQKVASLDEKKEELAKIKVREELGNRDYEKLKREYAALQEIFAQEEARRLEAVKSHEDEMKQRLTMEREISSLVNKYEGASEQITSLQQGVNYWSLDARFARRHAAMLQQQLYASYGSSQFKDQVIKLLREDIGELKDHLADVNIELFENKPLQKKLQNIILKKGAASSSSRSMDMKVNLTCAICMDTMKEETSTLCGHIFCHSCITSAINLQKKCPTCRWKLWTKNIHRIYLPGTF